MILGEFDRPVGLELHKAATEVFNRTLWMTLNTFRYYLDKSRHLYVEIPFGFLTDGATVPSIATSLFPRFDVYAQSALVHDYLCEYLSVKDKDGNDVPISRARADELFYYAMLTQGIDKSKAKAMFTAVRGYVIISGKRGPTYNSIKAEFEEENRRLLAERGCSYYK